MVIAVRLFLFLSFVLLFLLIELVVLVSWVKINVSVIFFSTEFVVSRLIRFEIFEIQY